jgi:hypothetical protein
LEQKTQDAEPDHPRRNKAFLVNTLLSKASQMKILILSVIFKFQTEPTTKTLTPRKFKNKYMECTIKRPIPSNPQTTVSDFVGSKDKFVKIISNSAFSLLRSKLAPKVKGIRILLEFQTYAKEMLSINLVF